MSAVSALSLDDETRGAGVSMPAAELVTSAALALGVLVTPLSAVAYRAFDLDRFLVPKELALHATAVVAGVAALWGLRRVRMASWDIALVAWIALSLLSMVGATNIWVAIRANALTLSAAVCFWAARRAGGAGFGRAIATAVAFAVAGAVMTSLAQAYGVKSDVFALNRAPGGTLGNRNFVAHLAAAGLPLVLWLGITARSRIVHVMSTAALLASAAALVLSRTRAAWLAVALWVVVVTVVFLRGPTLFGDAAVRRRARTASIAIAIGVLGAAFLPNTLDWRSDSPYLDSVKTVVDYSGGSGAGRVRQYANSLAIAKAHPILGVGAGNWPVSYPIFAPPNDPSLEEGTGMTSNPWPSSDWVAAITERGFVAAIAFAAVVVLCLGGALRARRDPGLSPDARLAAVAGGSVLFIAAVEGMFDAVFLLAAPSLLVWTAVGALLPPPPSARVFDVTAGKRRIAMAALTVVGAMLLLMTSAKIESMRLYARGGLASVEDASRHDPGSYRIHVRAAELNAARGSCDGARRHATVASQLFPKAFAPRNILARCGPRGV